MAVFNGDLRVMPKLQNERPVSLYHMESLDGYKHEVMSCISGIAADELRYKKVHVEIHTGELYSLTKEIWGEFDANSMFGLLNKYCHAFAQFSVDTSLVHAIVDSEWAVRGQYPKHACSAYHKEEKCDVILWAEDGELKMNSFLVDGTYIPREDAYWIDDGMTAVDFMATNPYHKFLRPVYEALKLQRPDLWNKWRDRDRAKMRAAL